MPGDARRRSAVAAGRRRPPRGAQPACPEEESNALGLRQVGPAQGYYLPTGEWGLGPEAERRLEGCRDSGGGDGVPRMELRRCGMRTRRGLGASWKRGRPEQGGVVGGVIGCWW